MRPDRTLDPQVLKDFVESESGLSFYKNNVSWIFTCPRCGREKKFYLRKRDGAYICFHCAETDNFKGKRPEYGLAELLGVSWKEIATQLYGEGTIEAPGFFALNLQNVFGAHLSDDDEEEDEVLEDDEFGPEPISWRYDFYPLTHKLARRGVEYLAGRGIPLDIALQYNIRYCPPLRRVYFPVEEDGILYGYQGRIVLKDLSYFDEKTGKLEEALKIESNEGLPRERMVMFGDRLKGSDHVILCEGPIDAIKAHLCGGNVASMGKGVSPGQIAVILHYLRQQQSSHKKRLYLALDPDASVEAQRLVRELSGELEIYEMHAPEIGGVEKSDLGGMSYDEVRELFLSAPRVDTRKFFIHFGAVRA